MPNKYTIATIYTIVLFLDRLDLTIVNITLPTIAQYFNVSINIIQLCFQACHFGAIFLIGLFLQTGVGFSATLAGLMMGMQAIGAMMTLRYSVKLYECYGAKLPIILGLTGIAVITPMILLINKIDLFMYGLFLFFVRGLFSGLCGTPMQTLSVIGFDKKDLSSVNSIFNMCRQVAISLGVAISSVFIALGLHLTGITGTENIPSTQVVSVFGYGFLAVTFIAVLGIITTYYLNESQ